MKKPNIAEIVVVCVIMFLSIIVFISVDRDIKYKRSYDVTKTKSETKFLVFKNDEYFIRLTYTSTPPGYDKVYDFYGGYKGWYNNKDNMKIGSLYHLHDLTFISHKELDSFLRTHLREEKRGKDKRVK